MNRTAKPDQTQGARRPTPQPLRTNRTTERARTAEPNRIDHPSRAASPTRHHEPARREYE
ncbi:hypothetical protein [Bradyrhizobium sp. Tv2a-2]|uniref:hypothetical protein n=1 Tax=Bradyrhizobium sp. Tv2a-2 TaxID=113395 RepID=UPI00040CC42B|nr:hypothetical protein [Bradyrhizobium sp. Tv2a-2]